MIRPIRIKRTPGERVFDLCNVLVMLALVCVTLYPLLYVAVASFSNPSQLATHRGLLLWPQGFSLASYRAVFGNVMIRTGYANTIFIVVAGTLISLSASSLGAFVLSRRDLLWKRPLTLMVVFTMIIAGGLIPRYLVVNGLGLIDSYLALLLPAAVSTYNMIIMRTSFAGIPSALEESATIDGAGEFCVFRHIVLPLSMPVVAVMILFYGVSYWNSWFPAMIYMRTRTKFPLQLILRSILVENSTNSMTTDVGSLDKEVLSVTIKYATIMVATVPILCVYPFIQKYFAKGVLVGSVKG